MASGLGVRTKNQLLAGWKFCLSIRKHDWELNDYPVAIREQAPAPSLADSRFKQRRYVASVVNWTGMDSTGDTEADALQALENQRYDVVLMDIQMPVMDGYECTAEIRKREQMTGSRMPIIALTAHYSAGNDPCRPGCGIDEYIGKPFRPRQLFDAIEGAIAGNCDLSDVAN
jgi:CheY-like chemotaxis protein